MKVDLSCPVEVRGFDITVFDHGAPRAYLQLYNLASDRIDRFQAIAHWFDKFGNQEDTTFIASDLRASPRSAFSMSLSPESLNAVNVEIEFTHVRFESERKDWVAVEDVRIDLPEYEPLNGREESMLLRIAGQGATRYAQLIPGAWLCVCGRANPLDADQCARCMRGREACLTRFTREAASLDLPSLPETMVETPPEPELPFESVQRDPMRDKMLRERNTRLRRTVTLLILALLLSLFAFARKDTDGAKPPVPTLQPSDMQILYP